MSLLASVVIPSYNSNEKLETCIACFDGIKDIEIIVIDDGSILNQKKFISKKIFRNNNIIFKRIKNSGVSNARNLGIKLSSGEYIVFVDSDDKIIPEVFNKFLFALRGIRSDNQVNIIRTGFIKITNKKEYIIRPKKTEILSNVENVKKNFLKKKFDLRETVTHSYRRDFLLKNNLFFKNDTLVEDADLLFRAIKKNLLGKVFLFSDIYYIYFNNDMTTRSKSKKIFNECFKLFSSNFYNEDSIMKPYFFILSLNFFTNDNDKKFLLKNFKWYLLFIFKSLSISIFIKYTIMYFWKLFFK